MSTTLTLNEATKQKLTHNNPGATTIAPSTTAAPSLTDNLTPQQIASSLQAAAAVVAANPQTDGGTTPANATTLPAGATPFSAVAAQPQKPSSSTTSVPADLFYFPNTSQPIIAHGSFSLTGNECISLARVGCEIVDLLHRCGFTPANDARFASLLTLWTFVHRYQRHALSQKYILSQQSRALEPALSQRSGLFTPLMHKQLLLQMRCASILWIDQHMANQMNAGVIYPNQYIPTAMLDVMRAFTKPMMMSSLNTIVSPDMQQQILKERAVMIQNQNATATTNGTPTPSTGMTYFQQSSLQSVAYPPNQNQIDSIIGLVGKQFAATDPCTLLCEVLYGTHVSPPVLDVRILKSERDRIIRQQMKQRKEELDMRIREIRDAADDIPQRGQFIQPTQSGMLSLTQQPNYFSNKPPAWMEIDSLGLGLTTLQRKVRSKILRSIPLDQIIRDQTRQRHQVEQEQRIRDKQNAKNKMRTSKQLKKSRKNYLSAITNHCRDFQNHHRELHKKLCVKVCAAILKYFEDKAKQKSDYEKQQEKQRLSLLKSDNEEAYIALLKEAKNERLLNLLKQTDAYMEQLTQQIAAEQKHQSVQNESLLRERGMNHKPTLDGHIPSAGEFMNGNVFSSSVSKWKKSDAELLDEAQEETPEEADRRRLQRIEEEERRARGEQKQEEEEKKNTEMPDLERTASGGEYQSAKKVYYSLAHSKKEEVVTQPKMLKGGQLRAYQMEGLQWLVSLYNNQLNGILADEMGLGKTVQSLSLIAYLMEKKHNYGPFLIIVPMSTLHNNWEFECDRWLPSIAKVVYDGDKDRRKYLRENFIKPGHFNIVMTTFEFAMRDKSVLRKIPWAYIIIDEAHRLKNPNCKLAQELTSYPKEARRVALTGTPLQNELVELWSLLNFLHPHIFSSSESFEKWFATPFDKIPVQQQDKEAHQAMNEEEKLLVINRLHAILRPFMLRREKKHVECDLVDKIEKVLRCPLSPIQKVMYQSILDGKVTMHNRVMQLRKICNHPILFHPYVRGHAGVPYSTDETLIKMCGKFTLLDQILHKLKRTGHRVLIFNQMTKVMDILEDYCTLRKFTYLRLDGSTSADVRTESLVKFNAPDSPYFLFMLSTKAGGLGLNLQSADTVILFDSDWNPQADAQAMARSHRIGQRNQVICLRFITTATVEEQVLATASTKLTHEQMVIQAGMFHSQYSHNQSRDIATDAMAKEANLEGETGDDADDQWTDDFISRTLARSDEELVIFQEMDAIAKQSEVNGATRGLPDGVMPQWCWDWCVHGSNSTSVEQRLTPFTVKSLDAARAKIAKASGDAATTLKARVSKAAIVEVNTSDSDDEYDAPLAESSGVNDAALNSDTDGPLNYDEVDDDDMPLASAASSSSATPNKKASASASAKKTTGATTSTAKKPKRKREDGETASLSAAALGITTETPPKKRAKAKAKETNGATPSTVKKPSTKKKKAPAPVASSSSSVMDDVDGYTPLSYSDAENDDDYDHYQPAPIIAASASGKMKLVIRK